MLDVVVMLPRSMQSARARTAAPFSGRVAEPLAIICAHNSARGKGTLGFKSAIRGGSSKRSFGKGFFEGIERSTFETREQTFALEVFHCQV